VHGQPSLWVADGSMLPTSTTVNPQGSIMAIARRNVLEALR
jgi:choline dehydrogenase-like flavoprotein